MNPLAGRFSELPERELYGLADQIRILNPETREALRAELVRRHLSTKKYNWNAQLGGPDKRKAKHIGDADGEYAEVPHGKYRAWPHVGLAFAMEVILIAFLFTKGMELLLHGGPAIADGIGMILGIAIATLIYWNRWRCIETFSSRHCSGTINMSLLYVPLIAFCYANYRGFRKLQGL